MSLSKKFFSVVLYETLPENEKGIFLNSLSKKRSVLNIWSWSVILFFDTVRLVELIMLLLMDFSLKLYEALKIKENLVLGLKMK